MFDSEMWADNARARVKRFIDQRTRDTLNDFFMQNRIRVGTLTNSEFCRAAQGGYFSPPIAQTLKECSGPPPWHLDPFFTADIHPGPTGTAYLIKP